MSHPYFFVNKNLIHGNSILITGEDHIHLSRVLRSESGDNVEVSDNESTRYGTVIEKINSDRTILSITSRRSIKRKKPSVFLFLCILKKAAMEFTIQKSAEIGIDKVIPVLSSRVVVDITGKKKEKQRILRWQQIANNAAKQCKRDFACSILNPLDIGNIKPGDHDIFFLPDEDIKRAGNKEPFAGVSGLFRSKKLKRINKLAYIIGPEGGFEDSEVSRLVSSGAVQTSFGKNVLRAETAGIYFASILDFLLKVSDEKDTG